MRSCGKLCWSRRVRNDIIWLMRFACWIIKDANTHREYVIVISFPQRQWLRKRASMLHLCICYLSFSSEKRTGLSTGQSRLTAFDTTNPLIYTSNPKCDWACKGKDSNFTFAQCSLLWYNPVFNVIEHDILVFTVITIVTTARKLHFHNKR